MIKIDTYLIKSKIYEKGYTIREIAIILNLNEVTITNWIHGRNIKQITNFIDLLYLLDIDIIEIKKNS